MRPSIETTELDGRADEIRSHFLERCAYNDKETDRKLQEEMATLGLPNEPLMPDEDYVRYSLHWSVLPEEQKKQWRVVALVFNELVDRIDDEDDDG